MVSVNIFDDASDALDYYSDIFNSVLSTHALQRKDELNDKSNQTGSILRS